MERWSLCSSSSSITIIVIIIIPCKSAATPHLFAPPAPPPPSLMLFFVFRFSSCGHATLTPKSLPYRAAVPNLRCGDRNGFIVELRQIRPSNAEWPTAQHPPTSAHILLDSYAVGVVNTATWWPQRLSAATG
ncbi:hypothetical protein EYF80_006190 [Liparis tanakae]|uniref:Uncharacterized protein n=1 Tax=Liparis tanakae TaxID=230148 RepID=A0A4Z2J2G0_9TELE|nr:hypothetical protein EYF80_006190 [Liparis tanakae]